MTCMYPPPYNLVSLRSLACEDGVGAGRCARSTRGTHREICGVQERLEDEGSMEGEGDEQWTRAKILKSTPYSGFV